MTDQTVLEDVLSKVCASDKFVLSSLKGRLNNGTLWADNRSLTAAVFGTFLVITLYHFKASVFSLFSHSFFCHTLSVSF